MFFISNMYTQGLHENISDIYHDSVTLSRENIVIYINENVKFVFKMIYLLF